jgi:DNA repair protein RecN (Recombination protein N)
MLEELFVKDYALIDSLQVEFSGGLNILSGETGAGKSIIIGALGFLLGGKADVDVIRTGSDETTVAAVVKIDPANVDARAWLAERSIELEDDRASIRRQLKRNGRGTAYIQNAPVTRSDLADFTACLFDIHGQHDHQALLRPETHRRYLDRFAGLETDVAEFTSRFLALSERKQALAAAADAERNRVERAELLRFAVEEIGQAGIRAGESAELEAEAKRLGEHEKLAATVASLAASLFDDESAALGALRRAKAAAEGAAAIDAALADPSRRLADLFYEVEDVADQFRRYRDDLSFDPDRLEAVEQRLAVLYRLRKKYGGDEAAVLARKQSAIEELAALERIQEDRADLEKVIAGSERELLRRADDLSARRTAAAAELGTLVTAVLGGLGMAKARFAVNVAAKGPGPTGRLLGPYGADEIAFHIAPNLGEPMKELTRIASGGELSRVMLAIKTVLSGADLVETLIFDEIDTGIGGEVALAVGDHLATIGRSKQIFCITHLATIAVRADNHLKVEKRVSDGRTTTGVSRVEPARRREEIARMLAGDAGADAALAHADELLAKYRIRS